MPMQKKPPRIYWADSKSVWIIRDGPAYVSTGTQDRAEALIALERYVREKAPLSPKSDDRSRRAIRAAMRRARNRANARKLDFDLTEDFLCDMLAAQGHRCAVTGLPFRAHQGESRRNPHGISIDRIRNEAGYRRDNVRLALVFVNLAMGDFGESVFRSVIHEIAAQAIRAESGETVR